MQEKENAMRDVLRKGIVEKSIQVLMSHGATDRQIKAAISKDFSISEEEIEKIITSNK